MNDREGYDFQPDVEEDILELKLEDLPRQDFDVVWASPPCPRFSVAQIGRNWTEENMPKTPEAADALHVVYRTLWLIQELDPDWWFLENPRGKLRRLLPFPPAGTVAYCQYGEDVMKPTDLWGRHPPSFEYRMCGNGASCHQSAGRGDDAGTQHNARDPVVRSIVPEGLSRAVLESVENPGRKRQQKLAGWNQ